MGIDPPDRSAFRICLLRRLPVLLGGKGCPWISEFCIAEFAAVVGLSTLSGQRLIADVLELHSRLPRLWDRIMHGSLTSWRARKIAERTNSLSTEGAAWVDAQLVHHAHKLTTAALDRTIEAAIAQFDPARAEREAREDLEDRHVTIDDTQASFAGMCHLDANLDFADALDPQAAVTRGAESLKAAGSTECLDVRRAQALGELARTGSVLPLTTADATAPHTTGDVTLFVHLSEAAQVDAAEVVTIEQGQRSVLSALVAEWCSRPENTMTVKPVIDLNERTQQHGYQTTKARNERLILRDGTYLFPWCGRPARRCDTDPIVPYNPASPAVQSRDANEAKLCRRHHRLKTHGGWSYTLPTPGVAIWKSPNGYRFRRTRDGTCLLE